MQLKDIETRKLIDELAKRENVDSTFVDFGENVRITTKHREFTGEKFTGGLAIVLLITDEEITKTEPSK